MNEILNRLHGLGIIPSVCIEDAQDALPLAKALSRGGLPCVEVDFSAAAAEQAVMNIAQGAPEILVGAGAVLTPEQAAKAAAAGAGFISLPGFDPKVAEFCQREGITVIPGCSCPEDINAALEHELTVARFIPAEELGGVSTMKALSAASEALRFIPTGGVNLENVGAYMACGETWACDGGWIAEPQLIAGQKWDEIENRAREAVGAALGYSIAHVGFNCADPEEAEQTAGKLGAMFGFKPRLGNSSVFAGTVVECMKNPGRGTNGHIGIRTNSVSMALAHLKAAGVEPEEATLKYDAHGEPKMAYLKGEVGGFAFHLIR